MDGAGKSAAARAVAAHLEAAGLPSEVVWWRLAEETATLDRIATPVKRALRFRGSVADPVAAMSRTDDEAGGPAATARRGPGRVVGACWTLVIATLSARSFRAVAARRRAGVSLVCDRWTADALVDLEVRYGRRRAASWILSAAVPGPDLAIVLEVDAATAGRRKQGDQAPRVLEQMEPLYAEQARRPGVRVVDARRPIEEVHAALRRLVDEAIAAR
jgi:thymidylate kinase